LSLNIDDMVTIKGTDKKVRLSGVGFQHDMDGNFILESGTPMVRLHIEAYGMNWFAYVPESEVEE